MHNIKFTILTRFECAISGIGYIHIAVQPSPLSISRAFPSSQTETLYPLHNNSCYSLHP